MKSSFELLSEKVCNNELSKAFFNRIVDLDQQDPQQNFDRILSQRIAAYSLTVSGKEDTRWTVLNRLIDSNPTVLFRVMFDWSRVPGTKISTRKLLLGMVSSLIHRDPESTAHIDDFIADIDLKADIKALNNQLLQKTERVSFVPQRVFKDLLAMIKDPLPIGFTQSLEEHIENMYIFEAISRFFLTYYFDLFCRAETETVTGYIHIIFLKLFSTLKNQGLLYWNQYQDESWQQQALHELVAADLPEKRHPLLRRAAFKSIESYNPLLSLSSDINAEEKKRYHRQLDGFLSLSTLATSLFLDTTLLLKGHEYVVILLARLQAKRPGKLFQLLDFLGAKSQKTHRELFQVVKQFIDQKPVPAESVAGATVINNSPETAIRLESEAEQVIPPPESTPEPEALDDFLLQEIIPIGFEKGAPKIPIRAFFEFPFGKAGSAAGDPFAQHLRYLEEAVSHAVLGEEELTKIRTLMSTLPVLTYRKSYDIYPLNSFDETILLIVFSLWQNGVLANLLQ